MRVIILHTMSDKIQGQVIKKITTKSGKEVELRLVSWSDLDEMTAYINQLSQEDTFITFSGEVITREGEAKYLAQSLVDIEMGNKIIVVASIDGKQVGVSDVTRITAAKERKKHVGVLGISIKKEFRGDGIGKELMQTAIEEAKRRISGLRQIILEVYGKNDIARAMYKKLGFVEAGSIPGGLIYKGEYIDDITMYLQL